MQILWQQMYLKRKTQALVLVNNSDIRNQKDMDLEQLDQKQNKNKRP